MTTVAVPTSGRRIIYPDTDGKPMAENTLQYEWIVKITGGIRNLFKDDPNVFVAGDLFWYPVEGRPDIRVAPDTLVAFGRPSGHRSSYMQWEEAGIAPQVVFEVLSPGNRYGEMSAKFDFYMRHGVEEYYIYNPEPDRLELSGFMRKGEDLVEVPTMNGHISPRLNLRFDMREDGLHLLRPDGREFITFEEAYAAEALARRQAEALARQAEQADQRAQQADQRAQNLEQAAKAERERAERLQAELDRLRRESRS